MALINPRSYGGSSVRPSIQERQFTIELRCLECRTLKELPVELHDEPDDPATIHDFYSSGAIDQLKPNCDRCGCESFAIINTHYRPTRNELRGME